MVNDSTQEASDGAVDEPVSGPYKSRADELDLRHDAGDDSATGELIAHCRELYALIEERELTGDEFAGLILGCYYLCAADYWFDEVRQGITALEVCQMRLDVAEFHHNGRAVLSAAEELARRIQDEWPEEARVLLVRVTSEYADKLAEKPLAISILFGLDQLLGRYSDMKRDAGLATAVLNDPRATELPTAHLAFLHGVHVSWALALGINDEIAAGHLEAEQGYARDSNDPLTQIASAIHTAEYYMAIPQMTVVNDDISAIFEEDPDWLNEPGATGGRLQLTMLRGLACCELYREDPELAASGVEDLGAVLESSWLLLEERVDILSSLALALERMGKTDSLRMRFEELGQAILELEAGGQQVSRKARSISALLGARLSEENPTVILASLEAEARKVLLYRNEMEDRLGGIGFLQYGFSRAFIGEIVRRCIEAHPGEGGRELALSWVVRFQALGSQARKQGYKFRGLAATREALVTRTHGVVVYLPCPTVTYAIGFNSESCWVVELERAWKLEEDRRAFLYEGLHTTGRGVRYGAVASQLAQDLIPKPVMDAMAGWQSVSITGTDLTDYVPFELLPSGGAKLFRNSLNVSYLPSIPVGEILQGRQVAARVGGGPSLALFISPTPPNTGAEGVLPIRVHGDPTLQRISNNDVGPCRVWQGDEATFESLSSPAALDASVLHLFMHGDSQRARPRPAGLLFAKTETHDGHVSCADIESLPGVAPIVILSVCEASEGRLRKGEDGLTDLGGAFLAAGAQVVILSPANLEVEATYELTVRLQARLLNKETPSSALAGAIRDLKRETEFNDPSHALMHVVGLGEYAPR